MDAGHLASLETARQRLTAIEGTGALAHATVGIVLRAPRAPKLGEGRSPLLSQSSG